ncbi:iqgap-related protein [Polyrhizophydium stewartii]|uniref:Iqgap-related protein n=1 Tax=Polyrhizophydium stewartii TaxID=2732419 RepID=A0ABR4N9B0_9FUNG
MSGKETEEDVHGLHGRHKLKKVDDGHRDGTWMESERKRLQAYEYLCHIGEAKEWIEACTGEQIPPIDQLEEHLRNGIVLARLAKAFQPEVVKRIFEDTTKLQFRHSDNINYLFTAMHNVGLPDVFFFELTDLYDKKNIPKVIYCIHALSHLLAKQGLTPKIKNLGLEEAAVAMPAFGNIQSALAAELNEETPEEKRKKYLEEHEKEIARIQALARGRIERKRHRERLAHFKAHEKDVIKIQAAWKGHVQRREYKGTLLRYKSNEILFTKVQALYKGKRKRQEYLSRLKYLNSNEDAAIKLQAWWKGTQAMRQYHALLHSKGGTDPKTLQSYIHLLDDGVNDFDEELDVQKLRRLVIKGIRENLQAEQEVNELDMKIALLVKNRISLEEVIHYTSKKMRQALAAEVALHDKESSTWTLKGSDKETKERRKLYEQLFYLLQTQPTYLARLMFTMNKKNGASVTKFLEQVVLTLYGYAQNTREEYLFLNLIDSAIGVELNDISKLEEFWRDNPFFIKLVLQYTRGAKERQYLRDLLQPVLKLVLNDNTLELESDPIAIYKSQIRDEELRTGEKSTKPYDVTPQQATQDPDVKRVQAAIFVKQKSLTDSFLTAIIGSIKKMPFGIRYIAMKMREHMKRKFPGNDSDDEINKIVGNLIYYRYMNPAIVAPEAFDVIDVAISPVQRKNLAEIAKTLHQISLSRGVGASDSEYNSQLNEYIKAAGKRFAAFLKEASAVESAQEHFNMDEYVELSRQEKPIIYISPDEVIQVHRNLVENIDSLATQKDDPLRIILSDLGAPPANDVGAKGAGSEVSLALTNRFAKTEDENETKLRLLINETKRLILAVIRINIGKTLLEILETPSTAQQEALFAEYLKKEAQTAAAQSETASESKTMRGSESMLHLVATPVTPAVPDLPSPNDKSSSNYTNMISLLKNADGSSMSFSQLKVKALENMAKIEAAGQATKTDGYQSMLNSIVEDMLNKQRRRAQRRREFQSLQATLANLDEKAKFLAEQNKSYHDYIDACMSHLSTKKGKAKKPPLFSKQYYHMRDLKKEGKVPQFGSFKYTAADLHKKGVLISIDDYSPKQYGQITLILSSDEAGVFNVEASFLGVKLPEKMELRLEDLLQSQYNKVDVMTLFDMAKVNLNLLIFLINKKRARFYV